MLLDLVVFLEFPSDFFELHQSYKLKLKDGLMSWFIVVLSIRYWEPLNPMGDKAYKDRGMLSYFFTIAGPFSSVAPSPPLPIVWP